MTICEVVGEDTETIYEESITQYNTTLPNSIDRNAWDRKVNTYIVGLSHNDSANHDMYCSFVNCEHRSELIYCI